MAQGRGRPRRLVELTEQQKQCLNFIVIEYLKTGEVPGGSRCRTALGIKHISHAYGVIEALIKKGYLIREMEGGCLLTTSQALRLVTGKSPAILRSLLIKMEVIYEKSGNRTFGLH